MTEAKSVATPPPSNRRVSVALGLGVLFLPVVFIWLLFRTGYSVRAQVIACLWMGVVGTALLLSAPGGPLKQTSAARTSSTPQLMTTTILDAAGGSRLLTLQLGETSSAHGVLRTPVMLTNNTRATLKYAEVLCVFYAADGKLLGNGLGNWVAVGAGKVALGEVVASDVELKKVRRRECRVRGL